MAEANKSVTGSAKKDVKPILQRKIGFEFQCTGEKGIFSKVEEREGKVFVQRAGHGEEIAKEGDVAFISDLGDYEFVIAPQDENDAGIALLKEAAGKAADAAMDYKKIYPGSFAQYRRTDGQTKTDKAFPLKKCKEHEAGRYHGYKEGQLFIKQIKNRKAHPQATVGIAKENLNTFLTTYMKLVTGSKKDIDNPEIKKLNIRHGGSISAEDGQIQIFRDILKEMKTTDISFLSEEAKGYVLLLRITAKTVNRYKPKYAKSRHPFMMRTSFKNAADLKTSTHSTIKDEMIVHEEELSKYIKKGTTGILAQANDTDEGKGSPPVTVDQLFLHLKEEYKFYADANHPDTYEDENSLFRDYAGIGVLQNIYTGKDADGKLIKGKESTDLTSFNIKKSTQITDSENGPEGMIMELRGLERGVEPKDWPNFVEKIALLSRYANPHVYPSDTTAVSSSSVDLKPDVDSLPSEMSVKVSDDEIREIAEQAIAQEEKSSIPKLLAESIPDTTKPYVISRGHHEFLEPISSQESKPKPPEAEKPSTQTSQYVRRHVYTESTQLPPIQESKPKPPEAEKPSIQTSQYVRRHVYTESTQLPPIQESKPKPPEAEKPSIRTSQFERRYVHTESTQLPPIQESKPKPSEMEGTSIRMPRRMRASISLKPLKPEQVEERQQTSIPISSLMHAQEIAEMRQTRQKPVVVRPDQMRPKPLKPVSYTEDKLKLYNFLSSYNVKKTIVDAMMIAYDKKDFTMVSGTGPPLSYLTPEDSNALYDFLTKAGFSNIKTFIDKVIPGFKGCF